MHALQFLATCMPKHDKPILQSVKMGILLRAKFASPSEFKCDSNALIFSLIGHELSDLREFCEMCPEMEIFHPAPLVLQTAVTIDMELISFSFLKCV